MRSVRDFIRVMLKKNEEKYAHLPKSILELEGFKLATKLVGLHKKLDESILHQQFWTKE